MLLFSFVSIVSGFPTLLLAHIAFNIPYAILSISPKIRQMDRSVYEAALDLGCRPARALVKVVLPEIMPGVVTSLILTFTLSIDDFTISYFTAGSSASTLAITIYNMARKGVSPQINALSSILFLVVLILLVVVNARSTREMNRKNPKNSKEVLTR
jgi:spermidine/putrescine transport system permease protein